MLHSCVDILFEVTNALIKLEANLKEKALEIRSFGFAENKI